MVRASMNIVNSWTPVIYAFYNRLAKCKEKSLSIGGRLTLQKLVLKALLMCVFFLYKAPLKIIDILEAKRNIPLERK